MLEECVVYIEENIRLAALEALPAFWKTYYLPLTPEIVIWRDDLVLRYIKNMKCEKEISSLGSSAAFGMKFFMFLN